MLIDHKVNAGFHSLRKTVPRIPLTDLIASLELSDEELATVQPLLTDQSSCYSLWIETSESPTIDYGDQQPRQIHLSLMILEAAEGRPQVERRFIWY